MTRNKKRKDAIREIANAEGIGIARAALLNDRGHGSPSTASIENAIREKEHSLVAWTLESNDGFSVPKIDFYLDSDSPMHEVDQNRRSQLSLGNPHYIIHGGVRTNRYGLLNYIWNLMPENPEIDASMIHEFYRHRENDVVKLLELYRNRIEYMFENNLATFQDYRVKFLLENKDAPKYRYVFIYDWHDATRTASPELIEQIRFLIHEGKKAGIHFLVSTETTSLHVQGNHDYALMTDIQVGIEGDTYCGCAAVSFRGQRHFMDIPNPPID